MSIKYTYNIIKVDELSRCMEIVYSSEGRQTMHVGARLPFEGEALEDVIRAFAPVPFWEEQTRAVVAPAVGVSGTITPPEPLQKPAGLWPAPSVGQIPVEIV